MMKLTHTCEITKNKTLLFCKVLKMAQIGAKNGQEMAEFFQYNFAVQFVFLNDIFNYMYIPCP